MPNHVHALGIPPVAPQAQTPPEPIDAASVALRIAARREELHRNTPQAVHLAARCVVGFHDTINGSLTTALRSRSESYARGEGTGDRAISLEDICELVEAGGAEGKRGVRAMLAPILSRLDETGSGSDVALAASEFLSEACDIPNALMLGKSDTEIRREANEAREKLRRFEKALDERARLTAPLAAIGARR